MNFKKIDNRTGCWTGESCAAEFYFGVQHKRLTPNLKLHVRSLTFSFGTLKMVEFVLYQKALGAILPLNAALQASGRIKRLNAYSAMFQRKSTKVSSPASGILQANLESFKKCHFAKRCRTNLNLS